MTTPLTETATNWHHIGVTPIPVTAGQKRPAINWQHLQHAQPPLDDCLNLLDGHTGIGIITGNTLEMLEFEGEAVQTGWLTQACQAFADHDQTRLWTGLWNSYIEQTPSGGIHFFYRTPTVARNTKIAMLTKQKVGIETRGEGGFVVVAPTPGSHHPTGNPWTYTTGTLAGMTEFTTEDRDIIFDILRTLNQTEPETPPTPTVTPATQIGDDATTRPGEIYNQTHNWPEILQPLGWTIHHQQGDITYWTRPGKPTADGPSATTGRDGLDNIYIFSTSTGYPTEQPITKFGFYTLTHHNGNYQVAAATLARETNQTTPPLRLATVTDITSRTDGNLALAPNLNLNLDLQSSDWGRAQLLAHRHQTRIRWITDRQTWAIWNDTHWTLDVDKTAIIKLALDTLTHELDGQLHQKKYLSRPALDNQTILAACTPQIRVSSADFDQHATHLNTPGGTIDLTTGEITPHDPNQLHTKQTLTTPNFDSDAPRFQQFLQQTFNNNQPLINYIQAIAGLAAIGKVTHHILPFFYGTGANGKSVLTDILVTLLADYATTAPAGFLTTGREDESATARLAGMRLVIASEVAQTSTFDEAKVKALTGGDKITSRHLYSKYFTFNPTHLLIVLGNHLPRVEGGGNSFWRRFRLIPFNNVIPENDQIPELAQTLVTEEGPAILAWICTGAKQVLTRPLSEPAEVLAATKTYSEEEDHLARFVTECLWIGGGEHVRTNIRIVREEYMSWCNQSGARPLSATVFGREMKSRHGFETIRTHGQRFYVNMSLLTTENLPYEED